MFQTPLMPPPPAPFREEPAFQVVSPVQAPPGLWVESVVPPTPVTYGCEAGSSTQRVLEWLGSSNAPLSPDAEKKLCPCAASCWNSVFSLFRKLGSFSISARPHEQLICLATLSVAILLMMSRAP